MMWGCTLANLSCIIDLACLLYYVWKMFPPPMPKDNEKLQEDGKKNTNQPVATPCRNTNPYAKQA